MPRLSYVHIDGGKVIEEGLMRVSESIRAESLKKAVELGAEPVLTQMTDEAPVLRGVLKSHILAETVAFDDEHADVDIGAFGAPHAHLVEFGHALVRGGKLGEGGQVVGHVPAHPFIRPALQQNKEEVVTVITDDLWRTIVEAWRKP